jgi:serine/threonine-protein kinase
MLDGDWSSDVCSSDLIYSAGCLLYELLTGRPPFTGDSPVSVAYQHVREAPVPPSHLDAEITPAMDNIVLKALAKDPADRYQSAAEMRADIGRLLAGHEVLAQPVPPTTVAPVTPFGNDATAVMSQTQVQEELVAPPARKRHVGLIAFLVSLAVIAVGVTTFLVWKAVSGGVEMVAVPSVVDRLPAEARQILIDHKLDVEVQNVAGPNDMTKNRVINQSPAGGEQAAVGTKVIITVNTGPSMVTIPSGLKGQKYDQVVARLKSLSFTNVTAVEDPNEPVDAKANAVTSVSPAEGSSVSADTPITVFYATGKSQVPNFHGLSKSEAQDLADKNGFTNIKFVTEVSTEPPGTVIKQSIPFGTTVTRTTQVVLTIADPGTPSSSPSASSTP